MINEETIKKLQDRYRRVGYLIAVCRRTFSIGEIVTKTIVNDIPFPWPVRVIGEATIQEFKEQAADIWPDDPEAGDVFSGEKAYKYECVD